MEFIKFRMIPAVPFFDISSSSAGEIIALEKCSGGKNNDNAACRYPCDEQDLFYIDIGHIILHVKDVFFFSALLSETGAPNMKVVTRLSATLILALPT